MDVIVLAIASLIWGAVLVGAAAVLQAATSLAGAARQTLWRIAAVLLIAPWIAAPLADLAGIGLPAPVAVLPAPVIDTISYESFSVDTLPSAESAVTVAPSPAAPVQPIPWAAILIVVTAAGWAWRFAAARLAARSLGRIVSASTEAGPGSARQSLAAWSRKLGLKTEPRLRIVDEGLSPFSFGILKPVICLPEGLERQLDREALDLVVAHECLHAARGDGWLRPLERFAADLLWFNPFAWRVRRELDVARELACDEEVLKHARAHRAYAQTLRNVAGIAAGLGPAVPAASMSLAGSPRSLMLRMKQALAGARAKPAWTALAGVAVFGVTGTLAACMQGVAAAPRVAAPVASVEETANAMNVAGVQAEPATPVVDVEAPREAPIQVQPAARVLGLAGKTSPVIGVLGQIRTGGHFGYRADPFTGKTVFHPGVDIAAGFGTPILAPADGDIIYAGVKGGWGRVVELDVGDGVEMRFGHLNAISVKSGDQVSAGQQIGTMGSTGRSTGPHVHFEYLKDGKSYDPVTVENLVLATSLKIDATPLADPAPAPQQAPPAAPSEPLLREIRAWYPARVTVAEPGRNGRFRVKLLQTADTTEQSSCETELDGLTEMRVQSGQELKVGDPIGAGVYGQFNLGEQCQRTSAAVLRAAFPDRAADEERSFSNGRQSSRLRGSYDPSLPGREIKAWYPAKVAVADGDSETGYKVRLVQTQNTANVRDCTVVLSKLRALNVKVGDVVSAGQILGAGEPNIMDFMVMCREVTDERGLSPLLNNFPELRDSPRQQVTPGALAAASTSMGSRSRGPGPVASPFDGRVAKVERLGDLYAVNLEAAGAYSSGGRTGEGCTTRIVGLAEVNVAEGVSVQVDQTIGRQDALDGYSIRCKSVSVQ